MIKFLIQSWNARRPYRKESVSEQVSSHFDVGGHKDSKLYTLDSMTIGRQQRRIEGRGGGRGKSSYLT